ncbi:MAG: type I-E CRISPR-associated protein Cas6/Cse3/CasE, partial [Rubricoccaceae bacterium]
MLSLTLLRLPRDHPRWRHLDPYQAHQLIWRAFSDAPGGERPFLFLLDTRGDYHSLLVQSTRPPDWSDLSGHASIRTKSFDPSGIPSGARMAFTLRANPTVDRRGYKSGTQRIGVGLNPAHAFRQMGRPGEHPTTPDALAAWRRNELLAWLARQADRGGFSIGSAEPGPIVARKISRGPRDRTRPMIFHEVEFSGTLQVTDPAAFVRSVALGLGRGRAFG